MDFYTSFGIFAKIMCTLMIMIGICVLIGGCKASPSLSIYQSAIAVRTGIQGASAAVKSGAIDKPTGRKIYAAGVTVYQALNTWNNKRLDGASDIDTAKATLVAAANALAVELKVIPTVASAHYAVDRDEVSNALARLDLSNLKPLTASESSKPGMSEALLSQLIIIGIQQIPTLVDWVNKAIASETVTNDQIITALAGLKTDLLELDVASTE